MFRAHMRLAALLTASAVLLSLPAGAASASADSVVEAALERQTRRVADKDPRWEVQVAARNALNSEAEGALAAFMSTAADSGYMLARKRAAANDARNDSIISRAIRTSTPATSPYVHLTAKRVQFGTRDEKDRYVRTGLAEAQALDAKHAPVVHAAEQAERDREYVADLAQNASGAWVKAAAVRAVQVGTNDAIAEFFKYSWASAADCDLQAFRMAWTEQQVAYEHRLQELVSAAELAQAAYLKAADAAKEKAAEEARLAWNTMADVAASTQATWVANQQLAASQAQAWQAVHAFAVQAKTQQDWPAIAAKASGTSDSWADEVAWAQEQARIWTELETNARKSANAIPVNTPSGV